MTNKLYQINKNGLPLTPVVPDVTEEVNQISDGRVWYLAIAAVLVSAIGAGVAWVISFLVHTLSSLLYYGETNTAYGLENTELGPVVILIPVAGAALLIWLSRYTAPLLRALGLTIAIGAGNPLGEESMGMLFNGGLGNLAGKLFHFTPTECRILFIAGICSALGSFFGAPIAAVALALEVLLTTYSLANILPVIVAAATAGGISYFIRDGHPFLGFTDLPVMNTNAIIVYAAIALIIGAWARLSTWLYLLIGKWFGKLTMKSSWYGLSVALLVGIIGYISPRILGTGSGYIKDLLLAHVTLWILFSLALLKWIAWLFFSGANKTGSGILPLLITGGAAGLLIGVIIQLLFPSVIMNTGIIVLVGMSAMVAGTSRALLTTIVLMLEMTQQMNAALPVLIAAIVAYSIAIIKRKTAADQKVK